MQLEPEHLTQAGFARHMGVSRAAVSQWKSGDILSDGAFTLPGRKGKVIVSVAVEDVRRNRDIGQSLGNGIETRTSTEAVADEKAVPTEVQPDLLPVKPEAVAVEPPAAPTQKQPKIDTVEDQLKRARLEEQHRKNRIGASEEALQQGLLMSSDDAREQMSRVAGMMLQIFEGALTDFAAITASQFNVPQRDVLHTLKNEFRKVRKAATQKEQARITELEKATMTSVELDG
ncbi:hypothetical protein [Halocynthiibacter namhaensis]|uniref:hypothetical protein n=1 Tax=Halocynthiibacter namhaensis TaxID=1290553 RepID=UPI0005799DFD|nr:hypothetical protein [Halocynthiibacter namhaensis]